MSGTSHYPLSQSQQLILAGQQLQPNDPLYNMVVVFEIEGCLDTDCFNDAFNILVKNCDALRTVFTHSENKTSPHQSVLENFVYLTIVP